MSNYLDSLEAEVRAAAGVLHKERYYEHIDCLYLLLDQAKHYQRLTEYTLSGVVGGTESKNDRAELDRATNEMDWYRYKEKENE